MFRDFDTTNVTRRGFLLGAGSIAATGYLVIGKAPTEEVHTSAAGTPDFVVTIDSRSCPQNPPVYSSVPPVSDASVLQIDPKQVVIWKAKTSGNHHRLAVLFIDDTPFVDRNSGNKVYAFEGSEADEAAGIGINAWIDPNANQDDAFEYFVGIWDDDAKTTCTDDPTIVIGKGGHLDLGSAIAKLSAADGLLKKAELADPSENENINHIEAQLHDLIGKLKKKYAAVKK
jgi:hypothetical protein